MHASPYKPSRRHCSPLALREQHTSNRERERGRERSASRVRIERHMEYLLRALYRKINPGESTGAREEQLLCVLFKI